MQSLSAGMALKQLVLPAGSSSSCMRATTSQDVPSVIK